MGGTYEPPVRGLGNPRPFKAGRRSDPSPITPLIAGLIVYDPQLIHRASAILVLTLAGVLIISMAVSLAISKILRIPGK
jgi:hypothetical protein